MILIPVIDSIKHNSDVDNRLFQTKLKKDLLKELTISYFTPPITLFCLPCRYIFDILGLNFSDTPDDCSVLCTYMK